MSREFVALTKEKILAIEDVKVEPVDVPEWGGGVYVKTLTGSERDKWESSQVLVRGRDVRPNFKNIRASLVAVACCDKDGKRLFSDADIEALGLKSAAALDKIYDAASKLNKLRDEDVKALAGE